MNLRRVVLLLGFLAWKSSQLWGLPLGFGVPQADAIYHQTGDHDFMIYHDARAPFEARMILRTLSAGRPILESWFDKQRGSTLPVVVSARTENASFANFITDVLELQTLGQGHRDLFWHEYVHATMYGHLRNFLGPAGTLIHLPWMPSWFIEGLAEALSLSVGSEQQASIERYQALNNDWPSYDRLHSLYGSQNFAQRGYATSGAFVSWILRKGYAQSSTFLPDLLRRFYKYTWPHYYPLSATPFSRFLPMDEALKDVFHKNAKELYEDYKSEARQYWQSQLQQGRIIPVLKSKIPRSVSGFLAFNTVANKTFLLEREGASLSESFLRFDPEGKLFAKESTERQFPKSLTALSLRGDLRLAIQAMPDWKIGEPRYRLVRLKEQKSRLTAESILLEREGQLSDLGESLDKIFWHETLFEETRLCYVAKHDLAHLPLSKDAVHCPISVRLPQTLRFLSVEYEDLDSASYVRKLWYKISEQSLVGDRHELWTWESDNGNFTQLHVAENAEPIAVARTEKERWLLLAERSHRSLLKIKKDGTCLAYVPLADNVQSIESFDATQLLAVFWVGAKFAFQKFQPSQLRSQPCKDLSAHDSPLLLAMRSSKPITLAQAVNEASLWKDTTPSQTQATVPLGSESKAMISENQEAQWHPRPILALPWIGADDALGYQFGVFSIPLMDRLQNETVYGSVLYGLASHYPNTELTLVSTRYWPQLSLSAYRRQRWNGNYQSGPGAEIVASYIDEKGVRAASEINVFFSYARMRWQVSLLGSQRDPYMGPSQYVLNGRLLEAASSLNFSGRIGQWSWGLGVNGSIAPESWNHNFDFNTLGSNVQIERPLPFLKSTFALRLEGARTRGRGAKTPRLRQAYFPLKTFVSGSGSGYGQNSFPLLGSGSLLQGRYGDSRARAELGWSAPVIKDLDKEYWILYFYELRFSSFVNYGGAWRQGELPRDRMLLAHAYSLDLLFENKGIHFNLGLGVGQVRPNRGQLFLNAGLDLMF